MKITAKRILDMKDDSDIELGDGFVVEFGEGYTTVAVSVRDGHIEVHTTSGTPLKIEPRAANLIRVSAVQFLDR
jgi:hypothetical protein